MKLKLALFLILFTSVLALAQAPQPANGGGGGGGSAAIACIGTPGNTIGAYLGQCQTAAGAVYSCNNAAGCTVAADWVALAGGGSFAYPAGTGLTVVTGGAAWGATITPATGMAAFLATPSSANLAATVTDETGTGLAVFGTSPTLVTPALGTPTALVLTSATGLPNAAVIGLGSAALVSSTCSGDLTGTLPGCNVASIGGKAVSLGGTFTTSGAFNTTFVIGATASFTMPTTSQIIPGLGKANTWSTGLQDFSAATIKVPSSASFVASSSSMFGYDSTATNLHGLFGGADGIALGIAAAPTTGHCLQASVSAGVVLVVDSGSTNCGGGGSTAWSAISNAAGALTLANGTNASTFNHTSGVNWTWANTTAAIVSASQSSPIFNLLGTEWHAAASAAGGATVQFVPGTGTDAASILTFLHTGSATGAMSTKFPGPVVATSFSAGTSPPALVVGTGGVDAYGEGTAPGTCATSGADCFYADSTQHGILSSFNGGSYLPLTQGPASSTSGHATCFNSSTGGLLSDCGLVMPSASGSATVAQTVASGTSALGTSLITTGACATVVTTAATGTAATDSISWTPNASIKAVTGYAPSTSGGLSITPYPTSGNVNFDVCNWTSGSITPGAVTLNWRVVR